MTDLARKLLAAAAAVSLIAVPTTASVAATTATAQTAAQTANAPASSPWLTLSAMTSSSSAASNAALQDGEGFVFPPWPVLAVILATIAVGIWILASDDDDSDFIDIEPISP